jgi:hypothetical protein
VTSSRNQPSSISPADDALHEPRGDDPTWAETAWFAAAVPERGLAVWLYPLFRAGLGVLSCGVYVWGPGADELWQQPYFRHWWHLPLPDGLDLRSCELPNGLAYECLEPLTAYRARFADGDQIRVELEFRALHPPHAFGVGEGRGHLDQLGRVTGELVLHGERHAIDCIEMRDRTWSPRRESRDRTRLGYSYGALSGTRAFHCATRIDDAGAASLLSGFVLRDGAVRELVAGQRTVQRDALGRPERIELRGSDEDGQPLEASGEVVSRLALHTSPYFV